jgi:hypothetical protein
MAEIHQLILGLGTEEAKRRTQDPLAVSRASSVLFDERADISLTYSSFAMVALPHRRTDPDGIWTRQQHNIRMTINPGVHPITGARVGVPFGARARLVMLYLQSEALKNNSAEVELGRSMHAFMRRIDMPTGGTAYEDLRGQVERIALAGITFADMTAPAGVMRFANEHLVRGGELGQFADSRWSERLTLSERFFEELKKHAVPLREAAVRAVADNSMAIDLYVWMAYRLHALQKPFEWRWTAIHDQFGFDYRNLFHFKPRFRQVLKMVTDIYPEAEVQETKGGFMLRPSAPPVQKRMALVRP